MYTQCPHCLTLFRINGNQLQVAAGKVRCCQCDQVFDALQHLQRAPAASGPQTPPPPYQAAEATPGPEEIGQAGLLRETLNPDAGPLYRIDGVTDDLEDSELQSFLEQDDGLETEPDYFAASSESQMSGLLDSEPSPPFSLVEAVDDEEPAAIDSPPPVPLTPTQRLTNPQHGDSDSKADAEARHPLRSSPQPRRPQTPKRSFYTSKLMDAAAPAGQEEAPAAPYSIDQMFEQEPVNYAVIAWGLGSLLLACALILQLAWHYRDQVIHKEAGRQLLTQMCHIAGCTVPHRRDTSNILVEQRDLRVHPRQSDSLLLQLQMVNRASFDQPYPKLHLSLFNDDERLIATRIFTPEEYLAVAPATDELMKRFQTVRVRLELLDPGKDVTGFKFDFL